MNLQNKTILITGGALRIGRCLALDLAEGGADIVIHYHTSRQDAGRLKKQIEALGRRAWIVSADLRQPCTAKAVKTVANFLSAERISVDVLINNASIFYSVPIGKIREKDWDDFLTVNLKAPFFLAKELGLKMSRRRSGKIINLTDWMTSRPHPDYLPYIIAKAGLHTATQGLAKALAPSVQVNSIAPGPILEARGMTPRQKKAVVQKTALKRFGSPEDIIRAVRYLIASDFVTGTMLPVEGGSLIQ